MKAIVQDTYGSADVLELRDVERPEVADDEVLVRGGRRRRGSRRLAPHDRRAVPDAHPGLRAAGTEGPRVPGTDVAGRSRRSAGT